MEDTFVGLQVGAAAVALHSHAQARALLYIEGWRVRRVVGEDVRHVDSGCRL
jgi:hypothetical protein